MPDGYYLCQEDHPLKRLQLPLDMIGASLDFLDGRSLTQFEMVSRWTRRAMTYEYPDMYKVLLMRQLANVPQMTALRRENCKRAIIAWDAGDFQPFNVPPFHAEPSARYLHRVALAGDGWHYLFGGHLKLGMAGDVWRFRIEEDPRKCSRSLCVRWEEVDGEFSAGPRGDNANETDIDPNATDEPGEVGRDHGAGPAHEDDTGSGFRVPSPRPCARCAASWTCSPGSRKIYLFGGQGSGENFLGDLWCFHSGGRGECRWELLTAVQADVAPGERGEGDQGDAPEALEGRWGHTMAEHRGLMYMFGGSFPGQACAGLWRLDTSVRPCLWSFLRPEGQKPQARGGHSATVVGDTLYIFGGNTMEEVFNDLWAIDLPECKAWRRVPQTPDFPPPRIGHSAMVIGNRILIYGGRNFNTGRYTTGLSCFDTDKEHFLSFPHAEAFSKRATERGGMWYDLRMTGHSAVLCSRGLLIVGGLLPPGHPTMAAWVLDVVGDRLRTRGRRRSVSGTNGKCGMS